MHAVRELKSSEAVIKPRLFSHGTILYLLNEYVQNSSIITTNHLSFFSWQILSCMQIEVFPELMCSPASVISG